MRAHGGFFQGNERLPLYRGEGKQNLLFHGCPFSMTSSVLTFSPFHLSWSHREGREEPGEQCHLHYRERSGGGGEVTDSCPSRQVTWSAGGRGAAGSPWNKAALPWTRCIQVSNAYQPDIFFGLHYFPQEEATWKWQLPCNLGTSWKTVITHHIIITCHCSLPFGTLASVSSILKFLPRPERQDKAFEMVSWWIFVSS